MSKVYVRGLAAVDRRSVGFRELKAWREGLERDLGGVEGLSTQKQTLIELCCRLRLYLDHIDGFLADQPSLVRKRTKTLLPIVKERQALSDSLCRMLKELGLQRVPKHVGSLEEYLEQRAKGAKRESGPNNFGGDGRLEDSGKDIQAEDGEGHLGDVEDISARLVRTPDDSGTPGNVPEVHGQE